MIDAINAGDRLDVGGTMTATDKLRKLLDERGVEYFKHEDGEPLRKLEKADEPATSWHMGGASVCAVPIEGSDLFDLWIDDCTPEQAVEATLGNEESYTRDDVESAFVSGYSLGCLPVGSDPQWDQNKQTVDEHMAELGWVRAATLGSGTCEIETTENWLPAERYHRCKHCGAFFAVMNASGDIQPCVCPNCGRKVKR